MASTPPPAFGDVLAAAQRAFTGLPITLEEPTEEELEAAERRFAYATSDWSVQGRVRDDEGGPRIVSLEIFPPEDEGAVTASVVRSVPVGQIIAALRTLLPLDRARREGVRYDSFAPGPPPGYAYTPLVGDPPKVPRRGGKPAVTDDHLRAVAEAYLVETAPGQPARPMERLAKKFGRPEETVRTWIARARKEGWLAPGMRGRVGGEPGPKLLAAQLAEVEQQHPGVISHVEVGADGNVTDVSALPDE
ncbi:hypothetical protein [Streptomyces sp. NPDC052192]|uniref:hypothetical protein n=1 Tax=Streptomyces sp. NPDC052192 TaxID=3155052 RepID=UPI003446446A